MPAGRCFTETARDNAQWWTDFWKRSFIVVDSMQQDKTAWEVGRNYQLFRYMLALNTYGVWPTKFNGGLLTVDPVYTDKNELTPDYRNWGRRAAYGTEPAAGVFPHDQSG